MKFMKTEFYSTPYIDIVEVIPAQVTCASNKSQLPDYDVEPIDYE